MRTSDIEKSLGPDSGDLMLLSISDRRSLTLIIASTLLSPFLWSYRYELTQDLLLPLVAMSILTCIPFAQLLLSNRGLLINPATVFAASFYVNYGFSAVDNLDRTYAGLYLNPYLADGAYWAALSLAAFMLGYYLPIGRPLASFAPLISTSRGTKQAQRLFLVSAFLTAIYYLLSVFGGAFFYRFLGGFDNLALALIALIAFDPNRKPDTGIGSRIWHPFAFSLLTLIPALNSGMRGVFLIPWVMLIICWYLARRHFPWFSFFAFTLLGIYLILPVLGFYKFARRGDRPCRRA